MKMKIVLSLLLALMMAGCQKKEQVNEDPIVTSIVNGVTLTHRSSIQPPMQFEPVNQEYRALYNASVMSQPSFSGKLVTNLENSQPYTVLGAVEYRWFAIAEPGSEQLLGYIPLRAVVKSEMYDQTVNADRRRPQARSAAKSRAKAKPKAKESTCVDISGSGKACKNNDNGTWVID